jgi:hypothetical protein
MTAGCRGIHSKARGNVDETMCSGIVIVAAFSLLLPTSAAPADDAKVKEGMSQVEGGAKKIPSNQIGDGVQETAKASGRRCPRARSTAVRS